MFVFETGGTTKKLGKLPGDAEIFVTSTMKCSADFSQVTFPRGTNWLMWESFWSAPIAGSCSGEHLCIGNAAVCLFAEV